MDGTPEWSALPRFVDDQEVLPVPRFVTLEAHRSSKAVIREKIVAATADDRAGNATTTSVERNSNG